MCSPAEHMHERYTVFYLHLLTHEAEHLNLVQYPVIYKRKSLLYSETSLILLLSPAEYLLGTLDHLKSSLESIGPVIMSSSWTPVEK